MPGVKNRNSLTHIFYPVFRFFLLLEASDCLGCISGLFRLLVIVDDRDS